MSLQRVCFWFGFWWGWKRRISTTVESVVIEYKIRTQVTIEAYRINSLISRSASSCLTGKSQTAYPACLIIFSNIHLLAHAIGIPEGPDRQLMQDSYLLKDVKISEFFGLFVVTVWVSFRCFGQVLAACVFVPYFKTIARSTNGIPNLSCVGHTIVLDGKISI